MVSAPAIRVIDCPVTTGITSPIDDVPPYVTVAIRDNNVLYPFVGTAFGIRMVISHRVNHPYMESENCEWYVPPCFLLRLAARMKQVSLRIRSARLLMPLAPHQQFAKVRIRTIAAAQHFDLVAPDRSIVSGTESRQDVGE